MGCREIKRRMKEIYLLGVDIKKREVEVLENVWLFILKYVFLNFIFLVCDKLDYRFKLLKLIFVYFCKIFFFLN